MLLAHRYWFVALVGLLIVALTACGGGNAAPTATPTQAAAAPTRTPRPTRPPEPTATPRPSPTVASTQSGQLALVDIGPLATYRHASGVFRIDVPNNWTLQDNSSPDELLLIWTDPTGNGAILVNIFEDSRSFTDSQLVDLLNTFLEDRFGNQPDFLYEDPRPQNDGSQLVVWSYTATAGNNIKATMLGNSFVEQRGNKISILTTLVPDEQFDTLRSQTDKIINTYAIDSSAALGGGTTIGGGNTSGGGLAPVEIGQLRTYSHPSGVFSLDLPVNWTLTDNSRPGELILVWTDPSNNAAIIVDVLEDRTQYSNDQLVDKLVTFLKNSFGNQPDFFYEDPLPQNDGSILIVWGYTSTASNNIQASMLGNSFIEQRGNKVAVLTTLVPEDQFDTLIDKTNEIINTYRINPDARVP
ncbi:hypothetical protein A6A03_12960 [Chloroflexus islandicus]|uniref:DUF1795 domain-containing protein n=1 Tax=Chloroflexus islandicus TaxID=1707952 RepID=A0A178MCK3_9CHLR|nr:hypothetical protein [Chloroflexus islandicus]OAN46283.1 hypothetical protein A6A03_12960 [Chloroflexus islandicus]